LGALAQLILRAINQSRSAYFAVRLRTDCFDTFRVRDMVQTAVYAKVSVAGAVPTGAPRAAAWRALTQRTRPRFSAAALSGRPAQHQGGHAHAAQPGQQRHAPEHRAALLQVRCVARPLGALLRAR